MRISDWSSDVCSSDLELRQDRHLHHAEPRHRRRRRRHLPLRAARLALGLQGRLGGHPEVPARFAPAAVPPGGADAAPEGAPEGGELTASASLMPREPTLVLNRCQNNFFPVAEEKPI